MTRRRLLLAAVLAGIVLGAVAAALATGSDGPRQPPAATATPTPAPLRVGPPRRPEDRLPDGRYSGEYAQVIVDRDSLAVAPHAAGDPGWAVRTFTGERRTIRRDQRTLAHPVYRQRVRCAELVRTHAGESGWVFSGRVFLATTPGAPGPLGECGSRARPKPIARFATVLAFPEPASPVIERTAIYGLAPPGARAVRLNGRPVTLAATGGFLALLDPRRALNACRTRSTRPRVQTPSGLPAPQAGHTDRGHRTHGSARADPAGGPGWAVPIADTKDGLPCVGQPGQVAGDRVGAIDSDYGLFTTSPIPRLNCSANAPRLTQARPCSLSWGGGGPDDPLREDNLARRARTERRVSGSRFYLTATCRTDVDRVTIRTPRDLRSLVPSSRAHIVFALYDGTFPSGEILVSAHLHSGATRSQRITPSL
jgi:hypothetical protein